MIDMKYLTMIPKTVTSISSAARLAGLMWSRSGPWY